MSHNIFQAKIIEKVLNETTMRINYRQPLSDFMFCSGISLCDASHDLI